MEPQARHPQSWSLIETGFQLTPPESREHDRISRDIDAFNGRNHTNMQRVDLEAVENLVTESPAILSLLVTVPDDDTSMPRLVQKAIQLPRLTNLIVKYKSGISSMRLVETQDFAHLRELRKLSLCAKNDEFQQYVAPALRHMTRLTHFSCHVTDGLTNYDEEPFQLPELQSLSLTVNLLCNQRQELLFNPNPLLKDLTITDGFAYAFIPGSIVWSFISSYIEHLETLRLISDHGQCSVLSWSCAELSPHLRALYLKGALHGNDNLIRWLQGMRTLTEVDLGTFCRLTRDTVERIAMLTGLQSLTIAQKPEKEDDDAYLLHPLTSATQLTYLSIKHITIDSTPSFLLGLVELHVWITPSKTTQLAAALRRMSKLRKLTMGHVAFGQDLVEAFSQMTQLQSLRVHFSTDFNGTFFHAFVNQPMLSELAIASDASIHDSASLSEIGCLNGLTRLEILINYQSNPCVYLFRSTLPELRVLSILNHRLSEEDKQRMRNRFPLLETFNDV